jgi:hypothetical protein
MPLQYLDRVKETTSVVGTGAYNLLGAVVGFRSFTAVGNGNTCFYAAWDGGGLWEVGLGTYSIAGTLARTQIKDSSNGGAAIAWLPGIKVIWLDLPASAIAILSGGGNTQIITTAGPVTVGAADGFTVLNKASPSATLISLPSVASRSGLAWSLSDWGGNGGDVTITPNGSEKIMGLSQAVVGSFGQGVGSAAVLSLKPDTTLNGWFQI